jgi:hypothetical protein
MEYKTCCDWTNLVIPPEVDGGGDRGEAGRQVSGGQSTLRLPVHRHMLAHLHTKHSVNVNWQMPE